MLGLSVHSLFEGLALGLEEDTMSAVYFMIALILHKFAAGISLSIAISRAYPNNFKILFWIVSAFAIATPIGVMIGMLLGESSAIVHVVFNSLAAGTFLYIACSEVIL